MHAPHQLPGEVEVETWWQGAAAKLVHVACGLQLILLIDANTYPPSYSTSVSGGLGTSNGGCCFLSHCKSAFEPVNAFLTGSYVENRVGGTHVATFVRNSFSSKREGHQGEAQLSCRFR